VGMVMDMVMDTVMVMVMVMVMVDMDMVTRTGRRVVIVMIMIMEMRVSRRAWCLCSLSCGVWRVCVRSCLLLWAVQDIRGSSVVFFFVFQDICVCALHAHGPSQATIANPSAMPSLVPGAERLETLGALHASCGQRSY